MDANSVARGAGLMPSKLDKNSDTERVHLVAPRSLMRRVKQWQKDQDEFLNLSAAIRQLLELQLDAYDKSREAKD